MRITAGSCLYYGCVAMLSVVAVLVWLMAAYNIFVSILLS